MSSSNVRKLVTRTGQSARPSLAIHPHMLRHACGFKLADDRHDIRCLQHYLGHKSVAHTVRYTVLAPDVTTGSGGIGGPSRELIRWKTPGNFSPRYAQFPSSTCYGWPYLGMRTSRRLSRAFKACARVALLKPLSVSGRPAALRPIVPSGSIEASGKPKRKLHSRPFARLTSKPAAAAANLTLR